MSSGRRATAVGSWARDTSTGIRALATKPEDPVTRILICFLLG